MKHKTRALLVIAALVMAMLACNLPNFAQVASPSGTVAPDMTLTALYAASPTVPPTLEVVSATATPTLPPIITATPSGATNPTATTNAGGGINPTATLTATKAAGPTATVNKTTAPTATIPSARSRAAVVAKFLSTAPTIDGDWSEWKDLTTEYPANNVVWGKSNWTGASDLSASFHIGWDNTYLYVAVKVNDDTYVQNASGENLFKGDSVEVLLDTKLQEDYYYDALSPDDFQLGIAPGRPDVNGKKEAYLWLPSKLAGAQSGIKIAAKQESGVYRVEAAIPWTVFQMKPVSGQHYGFALSVSDNDNTSQNVQQSMVSNDANRSLVDPTTWGDLQLTK